MAARRWAVSAASAWAQVIGSLLGVAWALLPGFAVYGILKSAMGLRLTAEEEHEGADLAIHKIGSTPEREVNWSSRRPPGCGEKPPSGASVRSPGDP